MVLERKKGRKRVAAVCVCVLVVVGNNHVVGERLGAQAS
jgi:hypothetical protein